jgi:hypothetical protein
VVERAGRGKLTGSCVLASQTVSASCSSESPSAPLRSAPLRSAPLRLALKRLVPLKSVRRSVGDSLTLAGAALLLLGQRQKVEAGEERGKTG